MAGKRASDDTFDTLHGLVADALIEQINAWKESRLVDFGRIQGGDEDKQYIKVFPPALLAQAIKFLSENGIDSPAKAGSKVDTLREAMPDFDDLQNVVSIRRS